MEQLGYRLISLRCYFNRAADERSRIGAFGIIFGHRHADANNGQMLTAARGRRGDVGVHRTLQQLHRAGCYPWNSLPVRQPEDPRESAAILDLPGSAVKRAGILPRDYRIMADSARALAEDLSIRDMLVRQWKMKSGIPASERGPA